MAEEYDRLLKRLGIVPPCRASYAIAEELPFPDYSFDLVHSRNAIDHSKDVLKALKEMIILVNLHRGRIEEATITAIIESTSGKKLQVDFGKDMTALIDAWQVVEE